MNPVISYIANLHPLSFMGYYVLSTTVIYILLNIIIAKTRPAGNTTAVPAPYSISPSFLAWLRHRATRVIQLAMFRLLRKNYVTLIHSAEDIQLCANQQYAECKMTCVEKYCLTISLRQNPVTRISRFLCTSLNKTTGLPIPTAVDYG